MRWFAVAVIQCLLTAGAAAQTPNESLPAVSKNPAETSRVQLSHPLLPDGVNIEETVKLGLEDFSRLPNAQPNILSQSAEGKIQAKAENGGEEGTEFWPTFAGLKLKITDTILAVFTAALFFATYALWLSTRALVRGSDKTAIRQLRPYVVLKPFIHSPDVNVITERVESWGFRCVWHNVGDTPTKHMITRVGLLKNYADEPLDFERDVAEKMPGQLGRLFLGPGNEAASEKFSVTVEELLAYLMDGLQIYLWGCADYSDTFENTPRHRTEFFAKIIIAGDPNLKNCGIGYQLYGPFNGIDEECYGKPKPYDPKLFR